MANIVKTMNEEIRRLARKEVKTVASALKKDTVRLKKFVASLRRELSAVGRIARRLAAAESRRQAAEVEAAPPAEADIRITAKGVRSVRRRLRLSAPQFAKLMETTTQTVYNWEKSQGPLRLRERTKAQLLAIRGIGAREAVARLTEKGVAVRRRRARRH
jgi:DNA-binding transcriptional regulator YiaG